MIVHLRLFAVARQRAGAPEIAVTLPGPVTVIDLKRAIAEQHPALGPLLSAMMVAVENEYVSDDHPIAEGDEVALIPPVSGGSRETAETLPQPSSPDHVSSRPFGL